MFHLNGPFLKSSGLFNKMRFSINVIIKPQGIRVILI